MLQLRWWLVTNTVWTTLFVHQPEPGPHFASADVSLPSFSRQHTQDWHVQAWLLLHSSETVYSSMYTQACAALHICMHSFVGRYSRMGQQLKPRPYVIDRLEGNAV